MVAKKISTVFIVLILIGVFSLFLYVSLTSSPSQFPVAKNFVVNENETLASVSTRLAGEGYIVSPLFFRAWVSFLGRDRHIKVGGYTFSSPENLGGVVRKFVFGNPDAPLLFVTIPEGSTSFDVATMVHKVLPNTSVDIFGENVSKYQADGKLFPSTYYLLPSLTEEDIVRRMMGTFEEKTKGILASDVIVSPLMGVNDVLSLASILEGEAKDEESMKMVAGILIKRLTTGMPLQVDVAKETYKMKGLPAVPINNPGLVAIKAVLYPTESPYLYYITGDDGNMYYAKTFEDHKRNIKKYLK